LQFLQTSQKKFRVVVERSMLHVQHALRRTEFPSALKPM
jgi:hypothetical protein